MGAESAATVTGSRFDKLQNNITCASDDLMFIVDADFPVSGNQRFTITKNITLTTNNADYRIYRTGVNASYVTGMFTIQNDGSLMITGSDTHTLRLDGNKSAVSGGSFTLVDGGIFTNNTASQGGGGVSVWREGADVCS